MASNTIYPMSPFPAFEACDVSCPPLLPDGGPVGPDPTDPDQSNGCVPCDIVTVCGQNPGLFETTILSLVPDVYWKLQETTFSGGALDSSINGINGTFHESENIILMERSCVPSDENRYSIKIASLSNWSETNSAAVRVSSTFFGAPAISFILPWIKPPGAQSSDTLRRDFVDPNYRQFGLRLRSNSAAILYAEAAGGHNWLQFEGSDLLAQYGIDMNNNQPHICIGIISPPTNTIQLYIDGILVIDAQSTEPMFQSTLPRYMAVGQGQFSSSASHAGWLSDWAFFKRALLPSEVTQIVDAWDCQGISPI